MRKLISIEIKKLAPDLIKVFVVCDGVVLNRRLSKLADKDQAIAVLLSKFKQQKDGSYYVTKTQYDKIIKRQCLIRRHHLHQQGISDRC